MQMVEHQVIYSPERKTQGYITNITSHSFYIIQLLIIEIFSLCSPLILLHHVRMGSPSFVLMFFPSLLGQLTLFREVRRAGPLTPLYLWTGPRKLWIQATARFFVGHTFDTRDFLKTSPPNTWTCILIFPSMKLKSCVDVCEVYSRGKYVCVQYRDPAVTE